MPGGDGTGPEGRGQGQGRGQGGGFAQGLSGECTCSNCGHREPHELTVPCYTKKCPNCGAPMTRA